MRPFMVVHFLSILMLMAAGCRKENEAPMAVRLHRAAREGDIDAVRSLIEDGCEVDARDERGYTPLHTAVNFDQIDVARFLISRGADVGAKKPKGGNLLRGTKSAKMARLLIGAGARVDPNVLYMSPPPHDGGAVEVFLARGAQIRPGDTRDNELLLRFAVHNQMHDFAEKLLAVGANANAVYGGSDRSVLLEAVSLCDKEMAGLLITHGADVNWADRSGMTALYYVTKLNKDVAELLLANGADLHRGGGVRKDTPLHIAVLRADKAITELFLAHGADVNARDGAGKTPLDLALERGHTEVAEILRAHGAVTGHPESAGTG